MAEKFDEYLKAGEAQWNDLLKKEEELNKQFTEIRRQKAILRPMMVEAGVVEKAKRNKKTPQQN